MCELLWRVVAHIVTRPAVFNWLRMRARETPYTHITSADGQDLYMGRWWLFNPYRKNANGDVVPVRFPWLPSIRLHHICRPDNDRHLHDHPWNARTIVISGWYREVRPHFDYADHLTWGCRSSGYTGRILHGQYHRISAVSDGGVWTMFFTWKYRGDWGFDVDGVKVPHRQYFAERGQ